MLNELHSLSNALSSMSISTKEWHREYKPISKVTSKAPCIRIWVSENGSIYGFDSIDAGLSMAIRKYGNNQNSFPAFKLLRSIALQINKSSRKWNKQLKIKL